MANASQICVLGPSGRMGKQVIELANAADDIEIVGACDREGSDLIGREIAPGVTVGTDMAAAMRDAAAYIDFTTPATTARAIVTGVETNTAAVIGTTGLDLATEKAIAAAGSDIPVLLAPNFSLGVNLLLSLAETAARSLGDGYDLEVVEAHHRRKRDSPSGTAIALAEALARGRGIDDYDAHKRYAREGDVGPRTDDEIGVVAVRGGDIIGEHTAYLIGELERIEITHRAASRSIFASGAHQAARWLSRRPPGRYKMNDVLGL